MADPPPVPAPAQPDLDRLYRVRGKAELVAGGLRVMEPAGDLPIRASGAIYVSLRAHERLTATGTAYPDNAAFVVDLPTRRSFSPDAAYFTGPRAGMRFLQGAPIFAAEVRSEGDYGPGVAGPHGRADEDEGVRRRHAADAEREMHDKRADYFAAGTLVVWDVDLLGKHTIRLYRDADPDTPAVIFHRGQIAHAEPAVPGWTFPVDDLFD